MASGGAQIAWGVTRFLLGLVLWCLAGLFVFVLGDGAMPLWAAITVSVLVMLGLPTLLTRLLIPAFAKLGEKPRWIELWPGLCGVVALLALVGPPLFARSFSTRKLAEVSVQHRAAPPWIKRLSETLSRWLAPTPTTSPVTHGHRDGGVDGDASRIADGAAAVEASVDGAIAEDSASDDGATSEDVLDDEAASGDANEPSDAGADDAAVDGAVEPTGDAIALVAQDASATVEGAQGGDDDDDSSADAGALVQQLVDPNDSASGSSEFARLAYANPPRAVWMGELALGGTDEVVVSHDDQVQVFYVQNDAIVERAVFAPRVPAGMMVTMARALVADIDGDGHRDLGLCAYFTTERGGTRGGNVWWARARANLSSPLSSSRAPSPSPAQTILSARSSLTSAALTRS